MAAHDLTSGVVADAYSYKGENRVTVQFKEIDCSETNLVSGDDYTIFNLPAGTLVLNAAYNVVTAEGAADTFDLGYDSTQAGFYNDASANSTGAVGTYVTPLFFAADGAVKLHPNAALTAAKIRFYVTIVDNAFV